MTDFTKILNKAKELEAKMKESQEKIKNIKVEGMSGANSVKVTLNGDGEMIQIDISPETMKEEKSIIEDLIVAAHNNAKAQLKSKTSEEISSRVTDIGAEAAICIDISLHKSLKSSVFATKSVSQLISSNTPNFDPG